jgi:hypothetical protein
MKRLNTPNIGCIYAEESHGRTVESESKEEEDKDRKENPPKNKKINRKGGGVAGLKERMASEEFPYCLCAQSLPFKRGKNGALLKTTSLSAFLRS